MRRTSASLKLHSCEDSMVALRLSGFTMNVIAVSGQSGHAMGLLRRLNSQRVEGQFCDCVIRPPFQPGPDKLYLAHRNVLAASSPVLASLLPPTGALLDLQGPCLTGEVLGCLLDYIYTGSLPPPQKERSLLSAATYLQMEELQRCLRSRLDAAHQSDWTADVGGELHLRRCAYDQLPCGRSDASAPSRGAVTVICHGRAAARPPPLAPSQGHLSPRPDRTGQGSESDRPRRRLHRSGPRSDLEDETESHQPLFKHRKLATTGAGISGVSEVATTGAAAAAAKPRCRGQRASPRSRISERCSNPASEYLLSEGDRTHGSSHLRLTANDYSCSPSEHAPAERETPDVDCRSLLFENVSDADDDVAESSRDRLGGSKFASRPCGESEWAESGGGASCGEGGRSLSVEVTSQDCGNIHYYQGQVRYHCLPRDTHPPAPSSESDEEAPSSSPNPSLSPRQGPNPSFVPRQDPNPSLSPRQGPNPSHSPRQGPNPSLSPRQGPNPSHSPRQGPNPSLSPRQGPNPSLSPRQGPNPSLSPRQGPNPSLSPRPGPNPSLSLRQGPNPNLSPRQGPNPSLSPRQGPNPNLSPRQGPNPSLSPRQGPNPSLSPRQGPNPSLSPRQGPNLSLSPKQDPNPSFSPRQGPNPSLSPKQDPNSSFSPRQGPNPSLSPRPGPNPSLCPRQGPNPSLSPRQGPNPSLSPRQGHNPSLSPRQGPNPSLSPRQGPNPSLSPRQGPNPSLSPRQGPNPNLSPRQGPNPNLSPRQGPNPSLSPRQGPNPSLSPRQGPNPSLSPRQGPNPSLSPKEDPSPLRDPPWASSNQTSVSSLLLLDVTAKPLSAGSAAPPGVVLGAGVPGGGGGGGGCDQPHQCSVCERVFSQRGSLNRHLRSHLGVRPYCCPCCPMAFSRQYRVTEHMRVHQRGSAEDLQGTGDT